MQRPLLRPPAACSHPLPSSTQSMRHVCPLLQDGYMPRHPFRRRTLSRHRKSVTMPAVTRQFEWSPGNQSASPPAAVGTCGLPPALADASSAATRTGGRARPRSGRRRTSLRGQRAATRMGRTYIIHCACTPPLFGPGTPGERDRHLLPRRGLRGCVNHWCRHMADAEIFSR